MNSKTTRIMIENYNLIDLLDNDSKSTGGACVQLHSTALGFKEIGCDVNVLVTKSSNKLKNYSKYNIIELYDKNKGIKFFKWFYYRLPRIIKIMKINRPEIIIQQCAGVNTFLYAIMAKIMNAKFVYWVANDMEVDGRLTDKIIQLGSFKKYVLSNFTILSYKIGLSLSDLIICQNNYQLKHINKKNYKKSVVIYNAFEIDNINNSPKHHKREYIAWAGKFVYQKNLPDLYYIANNNPNLSFKIAGIPGDSNVDKKTLKALDDLKLLDNISFVGQLPKEELILFLSKAKFLLNTSHYEGFSNTFMEAFSVGTPVITLGVNPDNILNKHKLGFVATKENFSELIENNLATFNYTEFYNNANIYLKEFHDNKTVTKNILSIIYNII